MNKIKKASLPITNLLFMISGAPGGIRTPDLKVRSLAFYPAKLQAHNIIYYTHKIIKNQALFTIL